MNSNRPSITFLELVEGKENVCLEAVKRGDESAKTKLAWYKLSGVGGCEIDPNGAVALLEERAKDKDAEAMWMLGVCNEFGRGIEQDIERAEMLYKQSKRRRNLIGMNLDWNKNEEHSRGSGYLRGCLQYSYKHWFICNDDGSILTIRIDYLQIKMLMLCVN